MRNAKPHPLRRSDTARAVAASFVALACALLVRCTPEPDPGQLGGVCVEGNLCDFGLACTAGRCEHDITSGIGVSGADAGLGGGSGGDTSFGGGSGGAGTGGSSSGGSGGSGSNPGGGGRPNGQGGTLSSGGSGGSTGGSTTLDAGVAGSGGSGTTCVGLPSVRGRCNHNSCLCPATNECFPIASAADCCAEAPTCN